MSLEPVTPLTHLSSSGAGLNHTGFNLLWRSNVIGTLAETSPQ